MRSKGYLNFLERHFSGHNGVRVGKEVAERGFTVGVVLHVESDRAARLGAAADVVELEAHEGFDEGALAVGLVADHKHRRSVEWRLELLCQAVQLIVGLVEPPLPLHLRIHSICFFVSLHGCSLFSLLTNVN